MPLSVSVLGRLHVLPALACDSITAALSNMSIALKMAKVFEEPTVDVEDDLYIQIIELRVQIASSALKAALDELNSILESKS